jgi:heme-degrading monooxygenase HmoA
MAHISPDLKYYTLINVFQVTPDNQRRMFDEIARANEIIRKFPGYVSGNIHVGHAGTRVVNYTQWRSKEDFDAMQTHPDVQEHFDACKRLADIDPIYCSVEYAHEADH